MDMQTVYIKLVAVYSDPVWGNEVTPWGSTQLIRVTRNRLFKSVYEWVGNPSFPIDIDQLKINYPLVLQQHTV